MMKNADTVAAHELALYAVNHGDLYRQRITPIILNLQRKIKRGVYNPALALKLWRYAADDAAKRYNKEYSGQTKGYGIFSVPTRELAAREIAGYYADELGMTKNPRRKNPKRRNVARVSMSGRKIKIYGKKGFRSRMHPDANRRLVKKLFRKAGFRVNPRGSKHAKLPDYVARDMDEGAQKMYGSAVKSRQIFVQVQAGESWRTVALVKDTPEMRVLAKRFAKTYKRMHPKETVRVCSG